jgi:iron complex outermembrane receptor protein
MAFHFMYSKKTPRKPPAKRPARHARYAHLIVGVTLAVLTPLSTLAESPALADLTIEELMNEPVTSVGKKETSLDRSPAAITVVTGDDVRRLGLTSIPEALRLVPGLDVARINASQWAISSRGFNQQYSNKLLVLMDGRSVYTPSFGGVFWDAQDLVLEDLDRIEVIRGPGATLWGANAVNGVINITSKNSKDTQGWLASTSFGTEDQPSVSLRYGGPMTDNLHYRAYLKYFNRDAFVNPRGEETPDSWDSIRGGFRTDWEPSGDDLFTLQGDYYTLRTGEYLTTPLLAPPFNQTTESDNTAKGGNVLGRWTRTFSDKSQVSLQAYFDTFRREAIGIVESRDTADVQLEHRFPLWQRNDVVWGMGYRFTSDEFKNSPAVIWEPSRADLNLYTAFIQDEITIVPDRLQLTLGSKFEHNDYTGWEIQPSARLLWTPTDRQTIWAAVSHAAGTPSRIYRGGRVDRSAFQDPFGPVVKTVIAGNSRVVSETLDAYELGYRVEPTANLSIDLTAFYNVYDNIIGVSPGEPLLADGAVPHLVVPLDFTNSVSGRTYGLEASVQWKPTDRWRLTANYSWLQMDLEPASSLEKSSPQQQVSLRSYLNLPWNLEFNSFASFVDRIESMNQSDKTVSIPSYLRVDAGIVWRPNELLEVGIWGQNLLDNQHPETSSQNNIEITEIPRSIVGKVTLRF